MLLGHCIPARFSRSIGDRSHERVAGNGLTLVELVVSLCVISLFIAVAIPIALRARESARDSQCSHNLMLLGKATLSHELINGHFPSNGWGYRWVGERKGGFRARQPGGWIYNIQPFLETPQLTFAEYSSSEIAVLGALNDSTAIPFALLQCPSRGASVIAVSNPDVAPINGPAPERVCRSDYAGNEGHEHIPTGPGPLTYASGCDGSYLWPDASLWSGTLYQRSAVTRDQILDGLSNTYLAGEKYVYWRYYHSADDSGYDQSVVTGADLDTNRCTGYPPSSDRTFLGGMANNGSQYFGSAHPNHCWMLYADGRADRIGFGIDSQVHRDFGNRADGLTPQERLRRF